MLTDNHMQKVSDKVNYYIDNNQFTKAKKVLYNELKKYPNEYWLLTTLANVLYELRDYKDAIMYSNKAMEIKSTDYLVLNNHACILSVIEGKEKEAIELLKKIITSDLDTIAYGEHGEGMRWAKGIVNDCRVRLALVYLSINEKDNAIKYINEHLKKRERGVFSNFSKREIIKKKFSIEKIGN